MYTNIIYSKVKALLIVGSALILVCCGSSGGDTTSRERSNERLMSEMSENLRVVMSENGRPSYIFESPLVEGYTLGRDPYREFNKGIKITTFTSDSLNVVDAVLTANYAIFYENRKVWETRGNVVVTKSDGKELYSEQLNWNSSTSLIYSNVETKILDRTSGDIYVGEGFESDEAMERWSFRKLKGRMRMEMPQNETESQKDPE
ncbi:MAG: LPS export ABC transporter periplasmic protein LptC [Rikenellaceae bacterium]